MTNYVFKRTHKWYDDWLHKKVNEHSQKEMRKLFMTRRPTRFKGDPSIFMTKVGNKPDLTIAMNNVVENFFKKDFQVDLIPDHGSLRGRREIMRLIQTDFPNLTQAQWHQAYLFLKYRHAYFDASFVLKSVSLYLIVKWVTTQNLSELEQQFMAAVTIETSVELDIQTSDPAFTENIKQLNEELQEKQGADNHDTDDSSTRFDVWNGNNEKVLTHLDQLVETQKPDWKIVNWNSKLLCEYWLEPTKKQVVSLDAIVDPMLLELEAKHTELGEKCYEDSFLAKAPAEKKITFMDLTAIVADNPLAYYLLGKLAVHSTTIGLLIVNQLQGFTHNNRYWYHVGRYSPSVRKDALLIETALLPLASSPKQTEWDFFTLLVDKFGQFWD